jgi:hypothetical protein
LDVGRQLPPLWQWPGGVLPPEGEPVAIPHTISYNPEWVSIDVRGSNFIIQKGMINHECVRTSLDLAFVITGPAVCPLPTITPECTALQVRDCQILDLTNENCLPKVIRHNIPPAFFPPLAGTDELTPTTGYVTIMDPSGGIETYTIRESPPNLTRVIRESPTPVGAHREMQIAIIEMELMAGGGGGGGAAVMIRESPTRASSGRVVGAASATTDYPADSFFDLFVEVDLPDLGVYALYNDAAIELEAHGITAMPPLGSSFMTPVTWQPVELLYAGGTTGSGYFIVEVVHDLPPPPPEWEVTVCDCIDPGACRVTQEFSITPTCTGGCPGTQVCTQRITTGFGTVDYSCECVVPTGACCPLSGPSPDCFVTTEADCLAQGGAYQGDGTVCAAPRPCCLASGSVCLMVDPQCCDALGGSQSPIGAASCRSDPSGNGKDDACEILDKVVCEPQGGNNPSHPPTYWYDVTPGGGFGRCDFHVRVYDPNPGDYTNWSMNPAPAAPWQFAVHQVGSEWWASWWDSDCSHAFFVKTRFQYDNSNASTWGDWTTTISNTSDPYDQIVDRSTNHPAEADGYGYRVHVPMPPTQACCLPNRACKEVEYNRCLALGGDPQGPGTICDMMYCPALKWAQPPTYGPVITPQPPCFWGWDDPSNYLTGPIVADDWACSTNQPITDIHWWGSYQNWTTREPPPQGLGPDLFHIGIWTDVPVDADRPFSHPGTVIHQWIVPRMELNERYVGCDEYPGMPSDICFRYDFNITDSNEWFYQKPSADPTVYWVSISAIFGMPPIQYPWGWKTREHFFNDDAVRILNPVAPGVGANFVDGFPIETQDGKSWDMAFVLTTICPDSTPTTASPWPTTGSARAVWSPTCIGGATMNWTSRGRRDAARESSALT